MIEMNKNRLLRLLRWSERYFKTDMVYVARSNFWLLTGRVLTSGSGFALTVAFANLLSPTDFGTYKYVLATSGIVAAFTLNGIGAALSRALNRGQQNVIPSVFATGVLWSIPSSIVALGIGGYYFYMGNSILGWSLTVIALFNPLLANLAITKSLFAATGDFRTAIIYNAIRNIVQVGVIIGVLFLSRNVLVIIITYFFISSAIGYVTYLHSLRVMKVKSDRTHYHEVIEYSKHLSILGAFQLVVGQIDQILLWHFATPVALATYAIAQGPARELKTVSDNINAMAFPRIAGRTREDAERTVISKTKYLLVIYVPAIILYILLAPMLFHIFFPQYLDAIIPSQLLALTVVFQSRSLADIFLFSHGTIKDRYVVTVPSQCARIVFLAVFIPLYGLYGAIIANILSEIFSAFMIGYTYKRSKMTTMKL